MTYPRSLKLTLCAGAMLVLAGCATSTPTADAPTDTTQVAEAPMFTINRLKAGSGEGEQICKQQAVTGSKFKRKLCATEAEWDKLADDNQAAVTDLKRKTQKHN